MYYSEIGSEPKTDNASPHAHAMDGDLGEAIIRPAMETLVSETKEATRVEQSMLIEELAPEEEETIMFEVEPPLIRTAVVDMREAIGTAKPETPVAKKKKKGKRDEIDDIFG
jgi:hypothetical protein